MSIAVTLPRTLDPQRADVPATQGPVSDPRVLGGEANATVNGQPAYRSEPGGPDLAELSWVLNGSLVRVSVSVAAGGSEAAARVAASVVAAQRSGVEVGMSFGWLPERARGLPMELISTVMGAEWAQVIDIFNNDIDGDDPGVRALLSSTKPAVMVDQQPTTVRGRRGS
ncbi:hypothetical protein ACFQX7_07960 [Luedemannella flava]